MKKVFYIVFAFYFISLAIVPCGDKDDCNETKHSQAAQSENHEHEDEACTPFCVCSCCAAHFVITYHDQLMITSLEIRSYRESSTSKVRGAILPIWQPPKLV